MLHYYYLYGLEGYYYYTTDYYDYWTTVGQFSRRQRELLLATARRVPTS